MPSVTDDPNRPTYGSPSASQIPAGGDGTVTGGQRVADDPTQSSELGRNVTNAVMALPGTRSATLAFPGAVSRLTGGAAAGTTALAKTAAAVAPYGVPAAAGSAVYNAANTPSTPQAGPSAAAAPADANALDVRLQRKDAPTPDAAAPTAPTSGAPVAGAPGVRRLLTPDGKVLYSNVDDAGNADFLAGHGGGVSVIPGGAGPSAAASIPSGLDGQLSAARAAAAARGDWAAVASTYGGDFRAPQLNTQPAPAVIAPVRPLGFRLAEDEPASLDTAGLSKNQAAGHTVAMHNAELTAQTARLNNQESNATARAGQEAASATAAQRLSAEGPLRAAQVQEVHSRMAAQGESLLAQHQYQQALAGGDQKAIQAAEDNLRAVQGKWEKTYPDLFSVTPINGGIDPVTGMPRGAGAIVVDKRTGATKVIGPDEAKGQPQQAQYEAGKVYKDKNGNRAKWDGKQFVPLS